MICTTFYLSWDIRPCPLTVTATLTNSRSCYDQSYKLNENFVHLDPMLKLGNIFSEKGFAKVLLEGQHYFWQVLSAGSKAEIHLSFSCGDLISCGSSHKISSLLLAQIRLCYNSEELIKNIVVDHWKTLSRCQGKITVITCRKLAYIINC